jgi:hypothetical protein
MMVRPDLLGRVTSMRLASVVVAIGLGASTLSAQPPRATAVKPKAAALSDSAREAAETRAFLAAEDAQYLRRLNATRAQYLRRAGWAALGDRCNPGALRVFPRDTAPAQRDSVQRLAEEMERLIVVRGVGLPIDTLDASAILRLVVGWEAGIDRPYWDVTDASRRLAIATGLTGEVPDPKGAGCLESPLASDTVTFVVPGFSGMPFPQAPTPRVKAYFGPEAQRRARDEFFAARGSKDPSAELSYTIVAPIVRWHDYAVVGVDRPREQGGVALNGGSHGGATYLLRKVGREWRLLSIVRSRGG